MTEAEAGETLLRMKASCPFREWFAVEIDGDWEFYDSKRKLNGRLRKAGLTTASVLTTTTNTSKKRRQ